MKKILVVLGVFLLLSACTTNVKRVQSGTERDLSGYWNAKDVRIVCDTLINECISSSRVEQAIRARGGKTPVVVVARFRNESSEHIDTAVISATMETAIFNSGKLDFVAGGTTREDIRAERREQQGNASEETTAAFGREIGADFIMTGTVRTIVDREENRSVRSYFVTAELTEIQTNVRIWMGQNNEVTKEVTRPRHKL